ncbi:hypothetical protein PBY51_012920 [Eleginops maclovinus]|uniref:Secreted protein n=1 Tax=Eleginops maclovinus TaxID=56733 RepID=A0AAN7Y461_ELEMC|nr:hypothetical protein PBY51_012920 [Eleginops maclovinus]
MMLKAHDPGCIDLLCVAWLLLLCRSYRESRPAGSGPSPSVLFTEGRSGSVPERAYRRILAIQLDTEMEER